MRSTAFGLALVASAVASPVHSSQPRSKRQETQGELCGGYDGKLGSLEDAKGVWDDIAGSSIIDNFITLNRGGDPNGWVKGLELYGRPEVASNSDGCQQLTLPCNIVQDCAAYYADEKFLADPAAAAAPRLHYWVFKAVQRLHDKLAAFKVNTLDNGFLTSLEIPTMIEELGGSDSDASEPLKWLAAATGAGGAMVGAAPGGGPAAVGLGFLSAVFGAAANEPEEIADDIATALGKSLDATRSQLDRLLKAAVGHADDPTKDYDLLPQNDGRFKSKIANFFDGGYWLVDSNADEFQEAIDRTSNSVKSKVADQILGASGFTLVLDKAIKTQEECGNEKGRQWMPVKEGEESYCMYMGQVDGTTINAADATIYDNMAKYAPLDNRMGYYRDLLNCAQQGGEDSSVQYKDLTYGVTPLCFYNTGAVFYEKYCSGGAGIGQQPQEDCYESKIEPVA